MHRTRLIKLLLNALLVFFISCSLNKNKVSVICVNSLNGNIFPIEKQGAFNGGFSLISGKIKDLEQKYKNDKFSLIANSNFIYGTEEAFFTEGKAVIDIMNELDFTCLIIGHREFYFGYERLKELSLTAQFPFISANILDEDSSRIDFIIPYVILDDNKTAILGFSTQKVMNANLEKDISGIITAEPVPMIEKYINELKDKGIENIILAGDFNCNSDKTSNLTHKEITDILNFPDIDLIFTTSNGHRNSKTKTEKNILSSAINGFEAAYARFDKGSLSQKAVYPISSNEIMPDKDIASKMSEIHSMIMGITGNVLGSSSEDIDHIEGNYFKKESDLGNFICDIMREYTGADVFLMNSGKIRNGIQKGPFTLGDLYSVLPYEGTVVTVKMTGRQLIKILEASCSFRMSKSFLQVSGLKFKYDPERKEMDRVIVPDVTVNGKSLDLNGIYTVSLTEYIYNGGDSYSEFGEMNIRSVKTHQKQMREILKDYILSNSPVSRTKNSRIKKINKGGE